MKFAILDQIENQAPPPEPENLPTETPSESEKSEPEPKRKISFEMLCSLINRFGLKLADDLDATVEEKVEAWVDYLKWIFPHIPDDQQHFKAQVQEMIDDPSQWDFMEKPKRHTLSRGKPFHYKPTER